MYISGEEVILLFFFPPSISAKASDFVQTSVSSEHRLDVCYSTQWSQPRNFGYERRRGLDYFVH